VIASGGAGRIEHFSEVLKTGVDAVLAAGVFHRDEISISQVNKQ
jgi:imidazole glycerol phosphate synthase subunit hisF (EC 4.1.3.-)